ncbi:MAG: hypothetical protein LBS54_08070 [Dysgonamonadaceae bacterium]|jgi:hypothetical protein|nr:hypothetical protein [Dysgonamonadaceae bacterium]
MRNLLSGFRIERFGDDGVQIHGGKDNRIRNNACEPADKINTLSGPFAKLGIVIMIDIKKTS